VRNVVLVAIRQRHCKRFTFRNEKALHMLRGLRSVSALSRSLSNLRTYLAIRALVSELFLARHCATRYSLGATLDHRRSIHDVPTTVETGECHVLMPCDAVGPSLFRAWTALSIANEVANLITILSERQCG
jgi:hypothetical protein